MGSANLWAWDDTNKVYVKVLVDEDGKLVIADTSFPATFPLPAAQIASLRSITDYPDPVISQPDPAAMKHSPQTYDSGTPAWRALASNAAGHLLVQIASLAELDDIDDVTIAALADGHFIVYSSGLGYWQNRLLAEGDIPAEIARDTEVATAISNHTDDPDAHHSNIFTITFIIDGGGSAITTGEKGHLEIPFACTITGWTILADQSGSIVVDVWKDTYALFPPTVADTIAGTEKPTLVTAQKNQDLDLTTWTTAIAAGDILAFYVESITTIERVTISLKVVKT